MLMFIIRTATYLLILVLAVNMLTIVIWSWDFDGQDNDDDDDGVDDDGLYLDDDDDRRQPGRRCGCAVPEADKVTPPCRGRHTYTLLWWEGWCHNWKIQQCPCNTLHLRPPTHLWATYTFHWRLPESSTALAWMPWLDVLTRRNLDNMQQWQLLHFHSCHLLWMNPTWYATAFRNVFFCPPKNTINEYHELQVLF